VCREVWSAFPAMTTSRHSRRAVLIGSALRLSLITIAWNGLVGVAALAAALVSGSPALAGFALNALLDSSASVVLVWRFRKERVAPAAAAHLERKAVGWIAMAMLLVAVYVGVQAVRALALGSHPKESVFGAVLAALSVVFLPWLGMRKFRVATELRSPSLRGDALLTLAAAALAALTLLALLLNSALGWWWADPLAALLIAFVLGTEAVRVAVRHRFG
jgi:divalent metal cation (Fe/Co/Zn/Cd) transporter